MGDQAIKDRLAYLRGEIEAERISYGELAELQSLARYIDDGDVDLLQWAGVPEHRIRRTREGYMTGWQDTLDLKDLLGYDADEAVPLTERQAKAVERIAQKWPGKLDHTSPSYDAELETRVDELRFYGDPGDEDNWVFTFNQLLDWADEHKIWIATSA